MEQVISLGMLCSKDVMQQVVSLGMLCSKGVMEQVVSLGMPCSKGVMEQVVSLGMPCSKGVTLHFSFLNLVFPQHKALGRNFLLYLESTIHTSMKRSLSQKPLSKVC